MNAIILCAGTAERMNGVDKQLLPIDGTTLLGRIIFQCNTFGVDPPKVITHNINITRFALDHGAEVFIPDARRWTVETFLSTKRLWSRRGKQTIVLLGDVFYCNNTFRKIASKAGALIVYGNDAEVFGVSFTFNGVVQKRLRATIQEAEREEHNGKLRNFWERIHWREKHWRAVNDQTMDVDSEVEYSNLKLQVGRGTE